MRNIQESGDRWREGNFPWIGFCIIVALFVCELLCFICCVHTLVQTPFLTLEKVNQLRTRFIVGSCYLRTQVNNRLTPSSQNLWEHRQGNNRGRGSVTIWGPNRILLQDQATWFRLKNYKDQTLQHKQANKRLSLTWIGLLSLQSELCL